MSMIDVLRSSVNTWDCDQMGHMNVRHYFARAVDGLSTLGVHVGLSPATLRERGACLRVTEQHVRFHREMRPGTGFAVVCGVLSAEPERVRVYEEMRFASGPIAATVVSEVVLLDTRTGTVRAFPPEVLERLRELATVLPPHAEMRGVANDAPRARPTRSEAVERGFTGAFLGPLQPEDVDVHGAMKEAAFMARISDGIAHFFHALREGLRPDGIGGAALEYRFVFHARPRLGDVIEVRSALKALGPKTLHLVHCVFELASGQCIATSEAVAVSFDLSTRKAVAIPDEARAVMQARIVPGIGI